MNTTEIYSGSDIAHALTQLGCGAEFVEIKTTPSAVRYFFNFIDVGANKHLKNAVERISIVLGERVKQVNGFFKNAHFCLELAKPQRDFVALKNVHHTLANKPDGTFILGVDENNEVLTFNIEKCPHLLVAGATSSGKSVFLNSVITSLSCYSKDTSLILIDPKQVEFSLFENDPRLAYPIITDVAESVKVLNFLCELMDERYAKLRELGLRDNSQNTFSKIIVVVDELADLMMTSGKEIEAPIVRIAQKGRACGLHLILATQRPTVNVITGLIKANVPTKIAFSMASMRDSMVILDYAGANELLGSGDSIVKLPDRIGTMRVQAPFISTSEIEQIFGECKPIDWKGRKMHLKSAKINDVDGFVERLQNYQITPQKDTLFNDKEQNLYDAVIDDEDDEDLLIKKP